jgi:acetylornithine deacetylase/succinyl-diaminopimelate desuccinylase-like protein
LISQWWQNVESSDFMMVAEEQIAQWLRRLVQIPSVTPEQAGPRAGAAGEKRLGDQVAEWFAQLGGEVHRHDVLPDRSNVYGIWRGRGERWAAVDVHMDTVGVEQMRDEPFDGRIEQGRVYGRGAVDTKASLAVALALLEAMQRSGQSPAFNLLIAATVDEEVGATGAPAFAQWLRARDLVLDQLVVAEPTQCTPVHGHKGVVRLIFEITGKAAHSSQPHLGKNAVVSGAHLVLAFEEENHRLRTEAPPSPLGSPFLTPTVIHGGVGINVVPDACQVSIDRRVVTGEVAADVVDDLVELAHMVSPLPLDVQTQKALDAFFQPPDTEWVQQLAAWSGQAPIVAPYGTNAWAYGDVARECVVIGPGSIDQAHGAVEWVEIAQLAQMAAIYQRWWDIG